MTLFVTGRTFKRSARLHIAESGLTRARERLADLGIVKASTTEAEALNKAERVLRFTITTGAVDREGDTINVKGWDFRHFKNNPVVLWSHESWNWPIGRAFDLDNDGSKVSASVKFLPPDARYGEAGVRADTAYQLALDGWISATSVGFVPQEWRFTDDVTRGADSWFPGIDFLQQELCEFSLCSVPANPEALIEPEDKDAADANNQERRMDRARRRRLLQLIEVS